MAHRRRALRRRDGFAFRARARQRGGRGLANGGRRFFRCRGALRRCFLAHHRRQNPARESRFAHGARMAARGPGGGCRAQSPRARRQAAARGMALRARGGRRRRREFRLRATFVARRVFGARGDDCGRLERAAGAAVAAARGAGARARGGSRRRVAGVANHRRRRLGFRRRFAFARR